MRKWESFSLSSLTHEVQIALSSECMSNETNHFMKLYAAVDDGCQRHQHAHVCVHLCIHQAEGQGLVTNQGLQQFTKTLKKQPLGGTEVFLGFDFFKNGWSYHRGRTCKITDPVPIPEGNILPLPVIIRSWWPHILITASMHCVDVKYRSGLLPETEAGMSKSWAWTGCQPQLSALPLQFSPLLLDYGIECI